MYICKYTLCVNVYNFTITSYIFWSWKETIYKTELEEQLLGILLVTLK